jgi:hypothetical protein
LRLTGDIYLTFFQETLPELLEVVPMEVHREMWFQHDGAWHTALMSSEFLNEIFGNRWIGRLGPITWPPRSPDLTPLGVHAKPGVRDTLSYGKNCSSSWNHSGNAMNLSKSSAQHRQAVQNMQ